jgi:hypothetical protein
MHDMHAASGTATITQRRPPRLGLGWTPPHDLAPPRSRQPASSWEASTGTMIAMGAATDRKDPQWMR